MKRGLTDCVGVDVAGGRLLHAAQRSRRLHVSSAARVAAGPQGGAARPPTLAAVNRTAYARGLVPGKAVGAALGCRHGRQTDEHRSFDMRAQQAT